MHVCWQRSTCTSAAIGFQRLLCSDFDAVSGELEGRLLSVEWTKRIDVCRCEFTAVQLELHALQQTVPVSDAFDAVQRLVLLGQDDSHTDDNCGNSLVQNRLSIPTLCCQINVH